MTFAHRGYPSGSEIGVPDPKEFAVDLAALIEHLQLPDVLRGFTMPTLFITGDEDTTYPPFLSDALAALMPNARVEQVREAGHSVYFQRASVFNQLVERFLAVVS